MATRYTVSDGRTVLTLEACADGGFVVSSPVDPELSTQGDTVAECFAHAKDAARALRASRRKVAGQLAEAPHLDAVPQRRRAPRAA
jgi:predicted RNase H-like HicB family nuclease